MKAKIQAFFFWLRFGLWPTRISPYGKVEVGDLIFDRELIRIDTLRTWMVWTRRGYPELTPVRNRKDVQRYIQETQDED